MHRCLVVETRAEVRLVNEPYRHHRHARSPPAVTSSVAEKDSYGLTDAGVFQDSKVVIVWHSPMLGLNAQVPAHLGRQGGNSGACDIPKILPHLELQHCSLFRRAAYKVSLLICTGLHYLAALCLVFCAEFLNISSL